MQKLFLVLMILIILFILFIDGCIGGERIGVQNDLPKTVSTDSTQLKNELKECLGEECIRAAIGECGKAKGIVSSIDGEAGLKFFVESLGEENENCLFKYEVKEAVYPENAIQETKNQLQNLVGLKMDCKILKTKVVKPENFNPYPIGEASESTKTLIDSCTGSMIDWINQPTKVLE